MTAPDELLYRLRELSTEELVRVAARFRLGDDPHDIPTATKFALRGETSARTLVGLATKIAAKVTAYTYGFLVNRLLDRPQGDIKELWA